MPYSSDHYEPVQYPEPKAQADWAEAQSMGPPRDWRPDESPQPAPVDQFHWHEALDRAAMLADLFERQLLDHPVIALTPELAAHAAIIGDALRSLYNQIGDADPFWNGATK